MTLVRVALYVIVATMPDGVPPGSTPSDAERAPGTYDRAERARQRGDEEEALKLFRIALTESPDDVQVHEGFQSLLKSRGEDDQLVSAYTHLLDERGEAWCYYLLGRVLHDPKREEELYRAGLRLNADDVRLRCALASALRRQERYDEALQEYSHVLAQPEGDSYKNHGAYMRLCRRVGKAQELPAEYEKRVQKTAQDVDAHLLYAEALQIAGRRAESDTALQRAEELGPDDRRVLFARGVFHNDAFDRDAALEFVDRARKVAPYHASTLAAYGGLLLFHRKDRSGHNALLDAVRLDPFSARNLARLGGAYASLGDFERAERCFVEAVRFDPVDDVVVFSFGELALARQDRVRAIEFFERAIELNKHKPMYYRQLASLYARQREPELAKKTLEQMPSATSDGDLARDPATGQRIVLLEALATVDVAVSLTHAGRLKEAQVAFASALAKDPDCYKAYQGATKLHRRLGEPERALALYHELRALCERNERRRSRVPRFMLRTAECLYDLGRVEDAVETYRTVWRSHRDEVSTSEFLPAIVAAIDSSDAQAESVRLSDVRIPAAYGEDECLPVSLHAVFRHWELSVAYDDVRREYQSLSAQVAVERLTQRDDVEVSCFVVTTAAIKNLLRRGYPVVLLSRSFSRNQFGAHASVITGFDDRFGLLFLEDGNWFDGVDRVPYAKAEGCRALLVAPPEKFRVGEQELPGQDYCRAINRGEKLLMDGEHALAARELRRAIQLYDAHYLPHYFLGLSYAAMGTEGEAIEVLQRCAKRPSAEAEVFAALGQLCAQRGKADEALSALQRAVAMEPRYWIARRGLATVCRDQNDVAAAIEHAEELLRMKPKEAEFWILLGDLCRGSDRTKAIYSFQMAAKLDGPAICYYRLGMLYDEGGESERAIDAMKEFVARAETPGAKRAGERMLQEFLKAQNRSP